MRRRIVAGNWKMNGSKDLVKQLVGAVCEQSGNVGKDVEVVIIPPAIYLGQVAEQGGGRITTGAQNVSQWQSGAYTGEISAEMARDMGCCYVLVGHSERRQLFGETDSVAAAKVEQVLLSGLVAVLCVGETLAEREAGQAEAVVAEQHASVCRSERPGPVEDGVVSKKALLEALAALPQGASAAP